MLPHAVIRFRSAKPLTYPPICTFKWANANVVACAAASATMGVLAEPGLSSGSGSGARRLMSELRKLTAEAACRSSSKGWARSSESGSASGPPTC
jgi:4-aminobutyrate aminotransferase-like enzyme